jgi:hypothetical protein
MNTTKLISLILIGGTSAVLSAAFFLAENRANAAAHATHLAEAHRNGRRPAQPWSAVSSVGSAEKSSLRAEAAMFGDGLAAEGQTAVLRGQRNLQLPSPTVPPARDPQPLKNFLGEGPAAAERALSRPREQTLVRQFAMQRTPDAVREEGGWEAAVPAEARAEALSPVGPTPVDANAPGNSFASGNSRVGVDFVDPRADGSMVLDLIVVPSSEAPPAKTSRRSVVAGGFTLEEELFRARWGWGAYEEAAKLATDFSQ